MGQSDERLYRVSFIAQGQVYEIYARHVSQGGLFGFIEVEELLFGDKTKLVVDPSEERLRAEFDGVRRVFIPLHAVIRIDEVEKLGAARIAAVERGSGTVTAFPLPVASPGSDPTKR